MKLADIKHHCHEVGECHLWKRATANGHPCIRHEGRNQLVRRALWESAHGPIRSAAIQRTKRRTQWKLSIEAVQEIRASDETTIAMAEKFGVAQAHISKIRKIKCKIDYSSPFAGLWAVPAHGGQRTTTRKSP